MTDTSNGNRGAATFLIRTLADPVLLYTVLIMMSIMYHYRSSLALAFGITTYLVGWVVFRIFDFVYKHHIIGFIVCVILYIVSGNAAGYAMQQGQENYPITWGLWFLTPQDSVRYNKWYTIAVFILFLIFMLSVVYYFTRVRYRIFMNFLIFIIPFTIYGKEYEKMPIGYIIVLAVGYVLMMVTFRQLRESQKEIIVNKGEVWRSVTVFAVLFAVLSTLFPKPAIEADRSILEALINADALTTRLNQMLDVFRDTSTGEQFRTRQSSTIHYVIEADQPMRLKTATFSSYDFTSDVWNASDIDTYYHTYDSSSFDINFNSEVADALFRAAELDADFAKKYGLESYAGKKLDYPEEKTARVVSRISYGGETVPVPQGATALTATNFRQDLALSRAAAVFTTDSKYYIDDSFTFTYLPSETINRGDNKAIVDMLGHIGNYSEMLTEAYAILDDIRRPDDETAHYRSVMNVNESFYDDYTEILLDYGNDQQIYDLAKELTAGLDSEYDKAKAIEWYFIQNGYIYDLDYQKSQGENVDDFLFRTKTGVCVEYATAMTLLSRAAGIPARYCEGYLMNEEVGEAAGQNKFYTVSANDGHAFPELYIKGYGWMTFEPTMASIINSQQRSKNSSSTTALLSRAGLVMLAIAALLLLFIIVMPYLTHKFFLFANKRRTPDKAVPAVMHRLCRLYRIPPTNTAGEAASLINAASGADITSAVQLFDSSVYGEAPMSEADKTKAMEVYITAYTALRESRKKKHKLKKTPQGGKLNA